ncbi:HipA domain-containing protein [Pseudarthrobacter sp. H3Y2-7]|uniref:HipA domain-containing protein n=1 Tax=Pseudarthrobacter naphthalenicus TaxID=3031328 RepID=UPI0023AEE49A|nr:HipA domain-containing protein [Pseudarthrobacter sp. H3Y2-7]MDE8669120.1 HipA domain-containing protein [Pseudarthrobacter sp. H3Y2-7]
MAGGTVRPARAGQAEWSPASKYAVSSVEVVLALAGLCKARAVASRNLYLQFLFAWLTGNGDLHAKNAAVLEGRRGGWVVAPMYALHRVTLEPRYPGAAAPPGTDERPAGAQFQTSVRAGTSVWFRREELSGKAKPRLLACGHEDGVSVVHPPGLEPGTH